MFGATIKEIFFSLMWLSGIVSLVYILFKLAVIGIPFIISNPIVAALILIIFVLHFITA